MTMVRRKDRQRLILLLSLLAVVASGAAEKAWAARNPFVIVTEVVPQQVVPGQKATLAVNFNIAAKHYLYTQKTEVIPAPISGLEFENLKKPPGTKKVDPYLGMVYTYSNQVTLHLPFKVRSFVEPGEKTIGLTVRYQGCTETLCFPPQKKDLDVKLTVLAADSSTTSEENAQDLAVETDGSSEKSTGLIEKAEARFGFFGVLAAAFIWGFLASLTPCVYPMIPITVSVIGAGSAGNALRGFTLSVFYVLGLSLTYAIFGVTAAWTGSLFGSFADHWIVRIIVALVFTLLALSMFDLFHIQTPPDIASKLHNQKMSGILGVFLTGAVAGAVVGPCVGPMLVGLLVYIATLGAKLQGFFIMWSFALGMGMIFLFIGTFSGAVAALPKSGGWMEKVKYFFGVLLMGFALYYVQPLLPPSVFLLIVGAFFIGIGVFVGALDPVDAESLPIRRFWKAAGIVFLVLGVCFVAQFSFNLQAGFVPKDAVKQDGISWMQDEAAALALARADKKPVMIDFYADWCFACKRLDNETFIHPAIIEEAKRFVTVKINCTEADDPTVKKLQQKYRVVGLPTLFFLNSDGQPLYGQAVTAFIEPETLLARMGQIK
jgi:thiol:disulfide interchange protein DsbD